MIVIPVENSIHVALRQLENPPRTFHEWLLKTTSMQGKFMALGLPHDYPMF